MKYTLDATNQSLGRIASKIALILRGKTDPKYQPHLMPTDEVTVTNIRALRFTGHKLEQEISYHYSGFPGGMKARPLSLRFQKNPAEVLRSTVLNMLPKNRLRKEIIKHLIIQP